MSEENKKLDLDFDDITEKAPIPEVATKSIKKKKEDEKPTELSSYIVMSKVHRGGFKPVDISTCSGEEFVEWAKQVYPAAGDPADFSTRSNRINAFKQIMRFHEKSLTWLRNQQRPEKIISN